MKENWALLHWWCLVLVIYNILFIKWMKKDKKRTIKQRKFTIIFLMQKIGRNDSGKSWRKDLLMIRQHIKAVILIRHFGDFRQWVTLHRSSSRCTVCCIWVSSTTQCRRSASSPFGECADLGILYYFDLMFRGYDAWRQMFIWTGVQGWVWRMTEHDKCSLFSDIFESKFQSVYPQYDRHHWAQHQNGKSGEMWYNWRKSDNIFAPSNYHCFSLPPPSNIEKWRAMWLSIQMERYNARIHGLDREC